MAKTPGDLIEKWRNKEHFQERAGIIEYDAKESREQAEHRAAIECEEWSKKHSGTEIQK